MNIRTISLFADCPKVDLLSCEYDHIALLKNDALQIVENLLIDYRSTTIIQNLLENARLLEWKEKINTEKDYLVRLICQNTIESPSIFIDMLCERGPEWAFDLSLAFEAERRAMRLIQMRNKTCRFERCNAWVCC